VEAIGRHGNVSRANNRCYHLPGYSTSNQIVKPEGILLSELPAGGGAPKRSINSANVCVITCRSFPLC